MDYIKNISILIFSVCLVFLPFSSIAQICSGASVARNKNLAVSSSVDHSSLDGHGSSLDSAQKYTYYDAAYDDTQNNILAVQSLIEKYTSEVSELSEEFLFVMGAFDAKQLQSGLASDWVGEKEVLEKALKSAGTDEGLQRQALQDYYFFLEKQTQDENIQQFINLFDEFSSRFEQVAERYKLEAKKNPYGYKLTENMGNKKVNPYHNECQDLVSVAGTLKKDLDKIEKEILGKTRKKQILERSYVGIVGKWQKLSDFITGKGKFAK